jgi:hypothetical protein
MLVVLGKGSKLPYGKTCRQLWRVRCDCGSVFDLPRGYFEINGQVSCGCKRKQGLVDNRRRPLDIGGQRFGNLQAIALTGKKDARNKPTWTFQCDCGNIREMSLSDIRKYEYAGTRINCGDRAKHPDRYLTYPPTPSPYPKEAGELLVKYSPLTEIEYQQIDSEVEDEKRDRLLRAAWIIAYRRSKGEKVSELHEGGIIRKHLRYCSIDIFWKRKLEAQGGLLYDGSGNKKEIGGTMTKLTSDNYPVLETQGTSMLSTKKLRFKRC